MAAGGLCSGYQNGVDKINNKIKKAKNKFVKMETKHGQLLILSLVKK